MLVNQLFPIFLEDEFISIRGKISSPKTRLSPLDHHQETREKVERQEERILCQEARGIMSGESERWLDMQSERCLIIARGTRKEVSDKGDVHMTSNGFFFDCNFNFFSNLSKGSFSKGLFFNKHIQDLNCTVKNERL